ncbi:MAG TPA: arginase family protein [Bryobacteraceae bacterium]|nr:arginase family protein [Bryobacteraceae bacterium]
MPVCLRLLLLAIAVAAMVLAQSESRGKPLRVSLVKMPYVGERNTAELSAGPDYLEQGGLLSQLEQRGCQTRPVATVRLSSEAAKSYGEWNRLALANGELARRVADEVRGGSLPVGLLANCSALPGMLAGLQHSGPGSRPLRVGLVFIDAHADYNTPETTLSGMLGGMPVALSAGLCLTQMRLKAGLDPALPQRHIVEAGVRDTDPLEQDLLDRSEIQQLSVADIRERSANLHRQMKRLSETTDTIYIHVDMDVLDPREVPGHPLSVPGGPTSAELGAALTEMFRYEKVGALGIASTPYGANDPEGISRKAAYQLILAAVDGRRSGNR